ncbi:MAG: phosphoethanolamine--lipid A transferase [Bacteriovorax sp.]|nr:phosphoethanolamine--lipid A transferase [Bacteriovorax sp.]
MKLKTTQTKLILSVALFLALFFNWTFFEKSLAIYPLDGGSAFFLSSMFVILVSFINIVLSLFRSKYTTKFFLILILLLSSLAAYVMDSYGSILDEVMVLNILHTDKNEAFDLFSFKLVLYFVFLGVIPSILIYKTKLEVFSFKNEMFARGKSFLVSLTIVFVMLLSFGKNYATFFRQHRTLRSYTNPTFYIFSIGKFASLKLRSAKTQLVRIGETATIERSGELRNLVIFVVGETARRDRFSVNGYAKETNPLLKKEKIISFSNMTSCGTSTAISVPCVFSHFGRGQFNSDKAATTENLLDILSHTKKVSVLWRDNNSNSKGVADRVTYEDFKNPPLNTICDSECRDVGMLVGLQDYINKKKEGDLFIVLHQMGNHGPHYYKRYPTSYQVFKPVCLTNELEKCTNEEINNAYDNAILYTDYFLSQVIDLLKQNSHVFGTSLFYVSDHGESLGENGVYLHGLPYFLAPDEQKNIPAIMWFGGHTAKKIDYKILQERSKMAFSHDNVFHTFLGLLDVKTPLYNKEMDILQGVL